MKYFVLVLFFLCTGAFGRVCTIDFENEVSGDPRMRVLFESVRVNASTLSARGYKLVSARGALPSHSAYILRTKRANAQYLSLQYFDESRNSGNEILVPDLDDRVAVRDLLSRLPHCQ